jgi:hypothetical protein
MQLWTWAAMPVAAMHRKCRLDVYLYVLTEYVLAAKLFWASYSALGGSHNTGNYNGPNLQQACCQQFKLAWFGSNTMRTICHRNLLPINTDCRPPLARHGYKSTGWKTLHRLVDIMQQHQHQQTPCVTCYRNPTVPATQTPACLLPLTRHEHEKQLKGHHDGHHTACLPIAIIKAGQ